MTADASLARAAARLMDSRTITGFRPLSGGDIAPILRVCLDADRSVVAKAGPTARTEATMLRALKAAGAPVPEVLAVDDTTLILEWIDGPDAMRGAWSDLGHVLRDLHAADTTAISPDGHYGWGDDFAIGGIAMQGAWHETWADFWAEDRLMVHAPHVERPLARRLEGLARSLPDRLPARPAPALLHGDLWSGNVLAHGDRVAALIDPACCIGDAEAEFGMLTLFARPSAEFYDAYGPRAPDAAERIALYRLWPALVHLRLFGSADHDMVTALLAEVKA